MMNQDVNVFEDFDFTQPESLTKKIFDGMANVAAGRISKNEFFRDNVVRNVLAGLDLPPAIKNNLLSSEGAQNFALNSLQQAIGSPVNVAVLPGERFRANYAKSFSPGQLRLESEFGPGKTTGNIRFDSRDFMIAPKTTAQFGAGLGTQGSDFSAGVTYRPDRKTFVEGRAMLDSTRGPEYRVSFGRRFAQGGIASL